MLKYDKRALKRLMVAAGLDNDALARKARLASRTVWYLVRGMTEPRASTLAKLAMALDVSVEAFFVRRDQAA